MRTIFSLVLLMTLGAGCVPAAPAAPTPAAQSPAQDAATTVNEPNCVKSGGTVADGACDCPENYAPDPAGFCLDVQGHPGGSMAPKP